MQVKMGELKTAVFGRKREGNISAVSARTMTLVPGPVRTNPLAGQSWHHRAHQLVHMVNKFGSVKCMACRTEKAGVGMGKRKSAESLHYLAYVMPTISHRVLGAKLTAHKTGSGKTSSKQSDNSTALKSVSQLGPGVM